MRGEQHLFPAAHLVAELLVAARLTGLSFEGAALLLDFEDDVVDTREVLLRRVELQFSRAPAGFVLGDARGFLDRDCRRSVGRVLRIRPILPCSMMA
ncbi:MAG: hypothetical protein QM736_26945 [Vicinamibacterales bacterium]